jgi:hypothetical protein
MPFLDDIGPDDEALQRPIWGVFALLKDNLERVLVANAGWAIQLLPVLAAVAFPQLPLVVRVIMVIYSALALTPATALLFVWMARVNQHEMLRLEMLKEDLRELLLPGLLCLAPLFGLLGMYYVAVVLLSFAHILLLDALARFVLLILLASALYWGPLFAEYPGRSPFFLLQRSLWLLWRYPGTTLVTGLLALLVMGIGVFSVAGFFLIAPAVAALLATRRCFALLARERRRQERLQKKIKVGVV